MKTTKFFKLSKAAKRAMITGSVVTKKMWIDADWSFQNRQQLEAEAAARHKEWKEAIRSTRALEKAGKKKHAVKSKRQNKQ